MFSVIDEVKLDTTHRRALVITLAVAFISGFLFWSLFSTLGMNVGSVVLSIIMVFGISWVNHLFLQRLESQDKNH